MREQCKWANLLDFDELERHNYKALLEAKVELQKMRDETKRGDITLAPALQPVRTDNP